MVSVRHIAYNPETKYFLVVPGFAAVHNLYIHEVIIRNKVFRVDNEEVVKECSLYWLIINNIKLPIRILNI